MKTPEQHFDDGCLYDVEEDYEKAVTSYTRTIEQDPTCEAAYFNRAIDWQELGNLENAIQDFKRFIELCPDDPTAHEYLAVVYAEAKTLSSNYPHLALEHARAALELTEGKACSSFLSLASSYAALNEFSLAVENQRRAIEISEQDTDVPVVLSILKQRLQEYLKLLETS